MELTDSKGFKKQLTEGGVVIEEYESDEFHKSVFENEAISQTNSIESLF